MSESDKILVGVDFAGPSNRSAQQRKILAVSARTNCAKHYEICPVGFNQRLLSRHPGWTATDLLEAILKSEHSVSALACDFPFSIPAALLADTQFAAKLGECSPFQTWERFNLSVRSNLRLACPIDYSRFIGWRKAEYWKKRHTDVLCRSQPPMKDRFQVLFNMTLLGNAFLGALSDSGRFDIVPFEKRGRIPVLEVYPGHAMSVLGIRGYKSRPKECIDATITHLRSCGISVELDSEIRRVLETYNTGHGKTGDYDGADAFVCAAVCILYCEGLARPMIDDSNGLHNSEGVIWSI